MQTVLQSRWGREKVFFLKGCQLRAVEIILLWVVHYQNLHWHILRELLARRRHRAFVFARSCGTGGRRLVRMSMVACFQLAVLCKLKLECAVQNVYPDCKHGSRPAQHGNESCQSARAAKARLAVSAIIGVPLEVATGPTCTPQGRVCI